MSADDKKKGARFREFAERVGEPPTSVLASGEGFEPKVTVVSPEEAEECDYVVCTPADAPSPFADNEISECSECGIKIQHRPNVPKKPPKLCMFCAFELL